MKKSFVITGCATACIAVLVAGLTYFSVYRSDFKKEPLDQIVAQQKVRKPSMQPGSNIESD